MSDEAARFVHFAAPGRDLSVECLRVSPEKRARHGHIDNAHDRYAAFDEGDVDSELPVALDEFFRAIEWVANPQRFPLFANGIVLVTAFLAEQRIGRHVESLRDDSV